MTSTKNYSAVHHCVFCGGTSLRKTHSDLYHTFKLDHGPFEFHQCEDCGSGVTLQPPSSERLGELYSSYKEGLPDLHREIMEDDAQTALYEQCARRLLAVAKPVEDSNWIDVGAGGGELSEIISKLLPRSRGKAVDLHKRPRRLQSNSSIDWIQTDINECGFTEREDLAGTADMVISTAVWEHVLFPDIYARDLLRLLKPGGVLYLMCPNYGSLARKVMDRRWPYFTPGEHLNMPTPLGARLCLIRQWTELKGANKLADVRSAAIALPYSIRYVLRRFRLHTLGKLVPPGLGVPLPSGALEAVVIVPH